jgi:hypothetical protein
MIAFSSLFRGKSMAGRQVILAVVAIALANGCSKPLELQEAPLAYTRIHNLASICSKYAVRHKRKPGSIEEVKAWVKKLSPSERDELKIEDPETAFVSPRDHQPYVLVRTSTPRDILAYEKIGEGGKHYVVTGTGGAFELDEADLRQRVPSAK